VVGFRRSIARRFAARPTGAADMVAVVSTAFLRMAVVVVLVWDAIPRPRLRRGSAD
jgi:hypothetical protein